MRLRFVSLVISLFALMVILPVLLTFVRSGFSFGGNQTPIASLIYSPNYPMPEETITFDASASYDPDGWIVQYTWDFSDGNVITVTNPIITHAYPIDGNYTVELTVTDNSGSQGVASAVIQVSTVVFFRVCILGTLVPLSNVEVTVYYKKSSSWYKAPVGSNGAEVKYDIMTQPDLANTNEEKYRNPGFTASILRYNASNIGFDLHPSWWTVYFKFKWGSYVAYWPNETTRVYTYKNGVAEAHDYSSCYRAYWDSTAGTYVINVNNIPKSGVNPTECHPIIVGVMCPPPTQYYLTVKTDPLGLPTIPGGGWHNKDANVTLTAPLYANESSTARYVFSYWDVDGISKGIGVNPITVQMNSNHTATAHYVAQYLVNFTCTGLSPDATGTVVTVDGVPKNLAELPFTKWVNTSDSVSYSYSSPVSSSVTGKRYRLNSVSGPSSPITVTAPVTVTGNYVTQFLVSFAQTGLSSDATGAIVTINGSVKTYVQLPNSTWVDCGSSIIYSYTQLVPSTISGKRFNLTSVTGPSSPIVVSSATTVTGNYVTQYSLTFNQTGLDGTATGTIVTVNGTAYTSLPFTLWFDSGSIVNYSYNDIVLSTVTGKQFKLVSVSGPSSPITVTSSATITGNYKIQYQVTFDQTGVGTDFTGTIVTIDNINYNGSSLPITFWWDKDSNHNFSFASPLVVNVDKQYNWASTSGLSSLQSGTLTITSSGSVIGNYIVANRIIFDQIGVDPDFTGTVVIIDGISYNVSSLPASFVWEVGTVHTFDFQSPLIVTSNTKQYVWTSTTGLSTLRNGSITVATYGSIIGNYKTQYYLALATNPSGVTSPSGAGWYDANTFAAISTTPIVNIVPSSSQYKFVNWTTADMTEITSPESSSTTVFMDKFKTVTANYVIQYNVTFIQSGVNSDFAGTVVTVDGTGYTVSTLPTSFWWNKDSQHTFAFHSPLVVNESKQYVWISTSGSSTLQADTLTITSSGSVTGNYVVKTKCQITFDQTGVGPDFSGTALIVDGANYNITGLSVSFWWDTGSSHNFSYQSPLLVTLNAKQYVWASTSGLSTLQSGSIIVSTSGSIIGNYKTQYYLALATNPSGVTSPSGAGWYDANTNATISTDAFVDIVPGASRYRFDGWTTTNMTEIADPTRSPTEVMMDEAKTVTTNYVIQYFITFNQSGVGTDFNGTIVVIDSRDYNFTGLPISFWWDNSSTHSFAFQSSLVVAANAKQYVWTNTTGLSTLQSDFLTISSSGSVTGNYKTQYWLAVSSDCDSPNPTSSWFDAGASINASVTSPWPGMAGTRYVCTGWTGTGDVPASGTSTSVSFTLTQPSSITWNWKTQYLLSVTTNPGGLSPQPKRNPPGEPGGSWWYDAYTNVTLTAQTVADYNFSYWDLDGASMGNGVNPIIINTSAPHTAVAYYTLLAPPLAVSIDPISGSIYVNQSITFTSYPSGGTPPYSYQWYLDNNPVSGATSSNWTFTPTAAGIYYVYLNVTDSKGTTVKSEVARIVVTSVPPPVGGYSVSLIKQFPLHLILAYSALVASFGMALSLTKRKRKTEK